MTLAAEIHQQVDDLDGAIALAERAVAAKQQYPTEDSTFTEAYLGELLLLAGRQQEGMACLLELRPLMTTEVLAGPTVAEALEAAGREELAVEWLTEALQTAIERDADLDDDDPELASSTTVIHDLAQVRHRIRGELGLDHDELDQLAHDLREAVEKFEAPDSVLFWPQPDFEALTTQWLQLAEGWEGSWEEHRRLLEIDLQQWSEQGVTDVRVIRGSADQLAAFADELGESEIDPDVEQGYLEWLEQSPSPTTISWPPPRNGTCWCGSGAKYKKCCLPRGRS